MDTNVCIGLMFPVAYRDTTRFLHNTVARLSLGSDIRLVSQHAIRLTYISAYPHLNISFIECTLAPSRISSVCHHTVQHSIACLVGTRADLRYTSGESIQAATKPDRRIIIAQLPTIRVQVLACCIVY
jgi:hypothetical protein